MKSKRFTVKFDPEIDKDIVAIIENSGNSQGFLEPIIRDFVSGDLIRPDMENLKREKMKIDIKFKTVCTAIKEKELLHWNTFDKTPSYQAKRAINKAERNRDLESVQVSAYDEKNNRFMCPECGNCFVFAVDQHDIGQSKEQFIDHYFQKHGEIPKSLEHELRELS